jgi:hypothetical protein
MHDLLNDFRIQRLDKNRKPREYFNLEPSIVYDILIKVFNNFIKYIPEYFHISLLDDEEYLNSIGRTFEYKYDYSLPKNDDDMALYNSNDTNNNQKEKRNKYNYRRKNIIYKNIIDLTNDNDNDIIDLT